MSGKNSVKGAPGAGANGTHGPEAPSPIKEPTRVYDYTGVGALAFLVGLEGAAAGKRYPLAGKKVTIGRDAEADIVLDDERVSSFHAEVIRDGSSFVLRDTGSRNGILYKGRLTEELALTPGEEFNICRNVFRFEVPALQNSGDLLASDEAELTQVIRSRSTPARRWRRWATLGGSLLVVALWPSSGKKPVVTSAVAHMTHLQQNSTFSGRLVPRSEVRVFASVSATVVRILVSEGQRVEKGAPLMALDSELLALAYERAKAELEAAGAAVVAAEAAAYRAQRKLGEDRVLAHKGILSKADIESSIAAVNARRAEASDAHAKKRLAETRLVQAKRDRDDAMIRAPISGQVTAINIKTGESPQDLRGLPVATIEDPSELLAEVSANEAKVGLLRPGQPATIVFTGSGFGASFEGKVTQVAPRAEAPSADGAATRYTAKVALANQDPRLRLGMPLQVRVTTAEKDNALVVPLSAVITSGRSDRGATEFVAKLDRKNNTIRWVAVETDLLGLQDVEVTSGLAAGDVVLSGPVDVLLKLKDGDEVVASPVPHAR